MFSALYLTISSETTRPNRLKVYETVAQKSAINTLQQSANHFRFTTSVYKQYFASLFARETLTSLTHES